nr:double homeobox protein 4C-like [Ovis aries]
MASSGSSSTSSGPVATGSRRRRLVLRLSQKDALQALFQQNPYPGIATRERLARELGIAESRVQVWFQNQRRRRFKQSRSPPEHVHQEGEAGPTSTPAPTSRPPRPQSSSPGDSAREARRKRTVVSPSQTSILVQAFRRDRFPGIAAREELGPRDAFAENGPAGAALGLTDQRPGGQAGCRMGAAQAPVWFQNRRARHPQQSPSGPGGAAATTPPAPEDRRTPPAVQSTSPPSAPPPPQESMPPSAAPAAPFGAPAFWVPGTAPGVCVGQPLMIFMVQPSPGALWPSGKPPPPAQVAGPWAVSSPAGTALGQPGQGAILPPAQPEAHIPRWPGSPYGEGSPSVQVALLAAPGIPGSPGPFPGSSPVVAGAHPAFPGSPSLLEEILAATATRDTPWSPPGAPAWDEGVEATLEAPLSEEDYQVSRKRCVTDTLPSVSRCLLWAGVRRSEPLSRQEGPTPPSRFLDHVHVYTRARYASKAKGDVPLIVHPPCCFLGFGEPPSPQ